MAYYENDFKKFAFAKSEKGKFYNEFLKYS